MRRQLLLFYSGLLGLCLAGNVFAVPVNFGTYGFGNISNNNVGDALIGEAQLLVDVLADALGDNQVIFQFRNIGPDASSITDVYFDNGTLLGIASIDNGDPGVSFSQHATPGNLPAANMIDPPFETTAGFSADSDAPPQPLGVNPGEMVGITFDLQGGGTVQDILDELADGRIRIGIHVQGFDGGGSESFVHVPEPTTLILVALGATGIIGRRRRQ